MKPHSRTIIHAAVVFSLAGAMAFAGGGLSIPWHTIDGGARMQSTGGEFELSGTIGQADASAALVGGDLRLTGGFWVVAVPSCGCLSDVNNDGQRDGLDVQGFLQCLLATGTNCACADVDGIAGMDTGDVAVFVDDLIIGATCP